MRIALALSAFITAGFLATTAQADDCETTTYAGVYSGYAFQDLGELIEDRPVLQGGVTRTCDTLSYDLWTSTTLSTDGPYGNRGAGDEIDLTVIWSDTVDSPIGTLEVTLEGSYWLLADFEQSRDDFFAASLTIGRPLEFGATTLTPYVQVSEWIALDGTYDTTLVRTGVSVSLALSDDWTADADVSHVDESYDGLSTWRADLNLTRSFEGGWSVTGTILAAERMSTVFGMSVAKTY